ncbi:hypothetical protein [Desulfatiglans anilini]|uniref:baeRF3 domain-containing protein n=1 Tax=Desulfatiglans anilini TaxID=90728 RepID=UPI00042339B4|nr:hypothetical protein [Desulfatiglans anilini]
MDRINLDRLRRAFIDRHFGWCVSLYMPTHRAGKETEQDPIRFKNLLRQAQERLQAKDMRSAQIQDLFNAPQRLLQDQSFWRKQSDGLAVFFSEDTLEFFRVPIDFPELIVVSDRFHAKPLLRQLTSDGTFHILAVSQNQLRLLAGTRDTVDEIELEDVPLNLSEAFPEGIPEKQLQFHTGTRSTSGGKRAAVFHGHELGNETKNRIRQWFRRVDKSLRDLLPEGSSPLVLAAVDNLFPLYKEVNTYPWLMDEGIPGNPERMKPDELHQKAWAIVEPVFKQEREDGAARYRQLAGTGQTTAEVTEAVQAALHGRIELVFVPVGVQVWGRLDPEAQTVDVHKSHEPGDEDILDFTAIQTLLTGGRVYAVSPEEVPDQAPLAAVLRY